MTAGFRIEKLRRDHPVDGFRCGREELDRFLIRYAFGNQQANASQTYLGLHDNDVIGFYSLVVGEVAYADAPDRLTTGLARHPVPIMLLARLAVCDGWQGRGIGAGLLKDAMGRTLQAADIGGIRAFAVHAKDASAGQFFKHFDFAPSPTDPLHLFLLLNDVRRFHGEAKAGIWREPGR
jgi:GNAT superfamily N-acetyltransferase